jgi:golgin subfamily B member 1
MRLESHKPMIEVNYHVEEARMSQELNLAALSMSPQELDSLELEFKESEAWEEWINFTRQLAEQQPKEQSRAIWRRLIKRFEQISQEVEESNFILASDLAFLCGQIWSQELERSDLAMKAYIRAYNLDPESIDALQEARKIYEDKEEWELALQLCTLEQDLLDDSNEEAALLLHMAQICAENLSNTDDAVRCVREAAKLIPDFVAPEHFAHLIQKVEGGRKDEFNKKLEEAEAARNPRQKARKLHEAAEVLIDLDPQDQQIEDLLNKSLQFDTRNEKAKQALQTFYQLNERWEALCTFLIERLANTQRRSDKLEILKQLAYITEHALSDEEQSAQWHRNVLDLNPVEESSVDFCVRYYNHAEQWSELVKVYESALRMRRRGDDEAEMLFQIAMVLWKKVVNYNEAEKYFKRIKLNNPRNPLMLNFYVDYYRAQEDWRRLLNVLSTQQSEAQDNEKKINIAFDMAEVAEYKLKSRDKTIEIWRSILKLDPRHAHAHSELSRLYHESGKWSALLELIKEELDLIDSVNVEAQVECYERLIEIYQNKMRQAVMVTNTYHQILEIDPQNEKALEALEGIYRKSSRWSDLADMLERRITILEEKEDQEVLRECYLGLAELNRDRLNHPDQSVYYFEKMLSISEGLDAILPLVKLYKSAKNWSALFEIYKRKVNHLEGEERRKLMIEMAQLADDRLGAYHDAINLWQEIVSEDPDQNLAWEALAGLYHKDERWENLSQLYAEKVEHLGDSEESISWMKKRAILLSEQMEDEESAANVWWQVLDRSQSDLHAEDFLKHLYLDRQDWASIERLYERFADWSRYVRLLKAQSAESPDREVRIELFQRLARCYADHLDQPEGAIQSWESVLAEDPQHLLAAETLVPYYREREQWQHLDNVLEIIYKQSETPSNELLLDIAQLNEDQLENYSQAYHYYAHGLRLYYDDAHWLKDAKRTAILSRESESKLEIQKDSKDDLNEGDALFVDNEVDVDDESDESLINTQACTQEHNLLELLESLVSKEDLLTERKQDILWTLADMYHRSLQDFAQAIDYYELYRAEAGESAQVLEPLIDLYKHKESWEDLLNVYQALFALDDNQAHQERLLAYIGELYEQKLIDITEAENTYLELLVLNEENLDALRGLQRIADLNDDQEALAEYLNAELVLAKDNNDLASLHSRIGLIALHKEGEDKALLSFKEALKYDEMHVITVRALQEFLSGEWAADASRLIEPFARTHEEWELLCEVLRILVDESEDSDYKQSALLEIATIKEEKLDDHRGSFQTYQQLLVEAKNRSDVLEALERLADDLNSWDELTHHYQRLSYGGDLYDQSNAVPATLKSSESATAHMSRRLARSLEEKLNDQALSCEVYESILEAEGDQLDLLREVDRLNQSLANWESLVQTRERILSLLTQQEEQIEVLFSIAQVYAEVIQNSDEAIHTYQRVIELEPSNQKANHELELLLIQTLQFNTLAEHLRSQLEFLEGEAYQNVGFQLSEVLHQKLNDASQALEILVAVLAISFHEKSIQSIEKMLVAYHDGSDESRAIRLQGCDLLTPLYADDEYWKEAIHLLEVRLEDEEDKEKRSTYSINIAQKLEQQGEDASAAFECYGNALREHFAHSSIVDELQRLAETLERWQDCTTYIIYGIDERLEESIEQRIDMLRLLAQIYETHLQHSEEAIKYQLLILEDQEDDRQALTELSRLYQSTEQFEELSFILEKQVESYQEEEVEAQRAEFAFALADLCEKQLAQPQRAIEVYQQIRLEIAPLDSRAYEALEQLYLNLGQFQDLVEIYLDEASQIEELADKKDRLYKAAHVYEESLESPDDAVNVYQRIVEEDAGDEQALNALARLYQKLNRHEDQLAVFAQQKELCEDQNKQDQYELQRALIFKDQIMDPISALESLQNIVTRQSHLPEIRKALEDLLETPEVRLEVAETLVPIYEKAEDWEPFVQVLHDTLSERIDVDEQVKVLRRLAEVEEYKLERQVDAFNSLAQAYRRTPSLLEVEAELERLADLVSLQVKLVELFNEVVIEVPEREIEIRSKVAHLAEEYLQDYQVAIDAHQEILMQEPEYLASLLALENLYSLTEDFQALADTLNQMLEIVTEAEERSALFERMASLYELKLELPQEAIDTWRKQLQEVSNHKKALEELERLLMNMEAFDELAAHYEEWIEVSDEETQVEVKTRLAIIYETQLQEGQTAVELYKEILELRPDYTPVQDALADLFLDEERCMQIGAERRSIADVLEPIYRAANVQEQLALVLEVKQDAEQDPAIRGKILLELAEIQEQVLQELSAAFHSRLHALKVVPDVQENRLILQRLAHKVGGYEDLAQALTETATEVLELDLKASILLELGKVLEAYLEDYDRAGECYQEILMEQPGDAEAIRALEALFTRLGQYQDLVDLYIRLADEAEEDDQRKRRYFQACTTLRNLDNTEQLIETYYKILELDETNVEAFKELEHLFKITERWMSLADLLQQQVELEEDLPTRSSLRHRLAKIFEDHLSQVDESIEIWQSILNDINDFEPAYESLERLAQEWRSQGADEPRRQLIAEILEPLYFDSEQWEAWLQTQEDLISFEFDPQEKSARLQKIAEIYEHKLDQAPLALNALARAFREDFAQADLQVEIDRLAKVTEEWSLLIHIYTDGIEEHNDPTEAQQLWLKIAQAYEVHLKHIDAAIESYHKAHLVDEMNMQPLDELERILDQHQKYAELVIILQSKAQLSDELEVKKSYLFRAGKILQTSLNNAEEAIDIYRQICQEDPDDLKAIKSLEELFRQEEQWQNLVMLLQDKLAVLAEEADQLQAQHQIAQVYQQELNQIEDACSHWRQVLELDPLDTRALQCLKESFQTRELWNDLLGILEEERSHYQDEDAQSIQIDLAMAQLQHTSLGDDLQALEIYSDILKRSATEVQALQSLELFLDHSDSMIRMEACRALQAHYQMHELWNDLVRIYDIHLTLLEDPFERLSIFKAQAKLKRDKLDDSQGSFYAFANALREDQEDEDSLEALQQIGGSLSLFAEMAQVYQEIALLDPHSDVAVKLFRSRAKLCTHRLNDAPAAMQAWSQVRKVDPEDMEALKSLSKLYDTHKQWSDLIEILRVRVDIEADDYHLRIRLGELLEHVEQDLAGAVDQWKQVLLDFPEAIEAQQALENRFHLREYLESMSQLLDPIYRDQEAWDKLVTLNDALLAQEVVHDTIRKEELWIESADLLLNQLDDNTKAFHYYCKAFRINPVNDRTRTQVFELGKTLQAWSELQTLLSSTLSAVDDPEMLCQDYIKLAQWAETHQANLSASIEYYQQALQVDPQATQALDQLERIYRQEERYTDLADILRLRLQSTYDDELRSALLKSLAELSWSKLQQADTAIQYYEELLMLDDMNADVYNALEQVLSAMQKDQALIELLERKAETLELSDTDQAEIYCQLAEIAVQIEDFTRAADAYRQVLDIQSDHVKALERLQSIYTHIENWDELRDVKEVAFQQAKGDTRFQLALELADLCQSHLMMPDDALDYFQEVLKQYPGHTQAFMSVRTILREQMRWGELIDIIEAYLGSKPKIDATQSIEFKIEVAQMADEEGDASKAIEYLNQVLELDPQHAHALTVLARLYEGDEDWKGASEMLLKAIDFAPAGSMRAEAWQRLGMIYWQQLEQMSDAKSAFQNSVKEQANHVSIDALLQIAREDEDESTVKHWLMAKIEVVEGQEKARTMIELSRIYKSEDNNSQQLKLLESAYQLDSQNPKVVEALVEIYIAHERWSEAEPLVQNMIELLETKRKAKSLARYVYRAGQLAARRGDMVEAKTHYQRCRQLDATYAPNLLAIATLLTNDEQWNDALDILKVLLLQRQVNSSEKVEIFYLNGITRKALGDTHKAKDMFQRALSLNADHAGSKAALSSLG